MSPSTISEVLNGHHSLSVDRATNIAKRLDWDEAEKRTFIDAVTKLHKRRYEADEKRKVDQGALYLSITVASASLPMLEEAIAHFEKQHPPHRGPATRIDLYLA